MPPPAPPEQPLTSVTLYGKPGCCLCEEAKAEVEQARRRRPFELREVDISLDPRLSRVYGERIPVVAVGERELFELHVDAAALCEAIDTVGS